MRSPLASSRFRFVGVALLTLGTCGLRAQMGAGPKTNTSGMDAQGTVHVTRVVPVPEDLSPEAQATLKRPDKGGAQTLAERRTGTDTWQARAGEDSRKVYPVKVEAAAIAGVPVREVTPLDGQMKHPDWVLIDVHGGGFSSDSGSLTESVPIANLTHARVVAVLYRLAPEHPFPAAVEDTVAVYKELLKRYKPGHIALYGTSAGAILTAEVAVRLRQLGLPEPGALGIFSGMGDFSIRGDSAAMYSLRGLTGALPVVMPGTKEPAEYTGKASLKDPVLSPMYADLHGMPPTLLITSERDLLLSGTANLHRAMLRAGVDARLVVFDGLPHAFWNDVSLPESRECDGMMADFFVRVLGR